MKQLYTVVTLIAESGDGVKFLVPGMPQRADDIPFLKDGAAFLSRIPQDQFVKANFHAYAGENLPFEAPEEIMKNLRRLLLAGALRDADDVTLLINPAHLHDGNVEWRFQEQRRDRFLKMFSVIQIIGRDGDAAKYIGLGMPQDADDLFMPEDSRDNLRLVCRPQAAKVTTYLYKLTDEDDFMPAYTLDDICEKYKEWERDGKLCRVRENTFPIDLEREPDDYIVGTEEDEEDYEI